MNKPGQKVLVKKAAWGSIDGGAALVDAVGIIVSVKPSHDNIHKYCIDIGSGLIFTNNKGYGLKFKPIKP